MANPLFNLLGNVAPMMPGPMGNMANLIGQLNQFRNQFRGDPRQTVQELLNSGRMSQEQFNQYRNMANQIQQMMR